MRTENQALAFREIAKGGDMKIPLSPLSIISSELYKNLDKYLDKKSTYTEPTVFNSKLSAKATWRIVWYEMISPGEWKRARPTGDLNRIKKIEDRLIAANLLCKMISEALAKGWRYYQPKVLHTYNNQNIIEALTANAKSKAATLSTIKSGRSYISWVKQFTTFLSNNHLQSLELSQLTPLHIQLFIDKQIEEGKSNKTINNIISGVSGVWQRMKRIYRLPHNPFEEVDKLPLTESTRFETYTDTELYAISNHLKENCPELWLFFLHIYYGYLRPATIVMMQRKHYNFDSNTLTINPDLHKNRKANKKQLLLPLRNALIAAGVENLSADTYIFSAKLKPGNELRSTSMAGKLWRRYVQQELGIDKKLYAAKHTGATNFLLDNTGNENIAWFQNQMGHSTLAESETYIKGKKVVKLDEKKNRIRSL